MSGLWCFCIRTCDHFHCRGCQKQIPRKKKKKKSCVIALVNELKLITRPVCRSVSLNLSFWLHDHRRRREDRGRRGEMANPCGVTAERGWVKENLIYYQDLHCQSTLNLVWANAWLSGFFCIYDYGWGYAASLVFLLEKEGSGIGFLPVWDNILNFDCFTLSYFIYLIICATRDWLVAMHFIYFIIS